MIKIYQKTQKELQEEESLNAFANAVVRGTKEEVCPTYVILNGEKKDTWNLTEEDVFSLVIHDVDDFSRDSISYNKRRGKPGIDSFDLFNVLSKNFKLSPKGNIYFLELEKRYGHIMIDLLGGLTKMETMNQARIIAKFQKETNGDFSYVTADEIQSIIEQMALNEKNRKKQTKKR